MAYTKHTWSDGETITDALLNNIEDGVEANDTAIATKADASSLSEKADKSEISDMLTKTEAGSTYATKSELGGKAAKGSNISTADATSSASTETVDPTEFAAVVTLVNECKKQLNAMNA